MAICPRCSFKVETPAKVWPLMKKGEVEVYMGIFQCPNCKTRFRRRVERPLKETSIKSISGKIKEIKGELMQTLKNLREKIKTLEAERASLLLEIEELKKMAESKANALENEVKMLREEVKSLRELLSGTESK